MTAPGPNQLTVLLEKIARGEAEGSALIGMVYEELRLLADQQLRREADAGGATLSPTALVHEAYLRLSGSGDQSWENRRHFFGSAARAMRQVLVDRARRRASLHRAVGPRRPLDDDALSAEPPPGEVLALDRAMAQLEARDVRRAEIVLLRFYAGLSIEQTAAAMALSPATIKNEWAYARAWLRRELARDEGAAGEQA